MEEQNHADRMRAVGKMITQARENMRAKEEQFMQTSLTGDPEAVRFLTDAKQALQTWEQKVNAKDDRMTNDEKDTDMESTGGDDQPLVQPSSASPQGNLIGEVQQGLASRLKDWSPEEALANTREREREKKTGLPLPDAVAAKTREREKKTAERAAVRQFEDNLASEAKKITEGQEPTHTLHKDMSNCIICFITCV
jgi:hypothetical protein